MCEESLLTEESYCVPMTQNLKLEGVLKREPDTGDPFLRSGW